MPDTTRQDTTRPARRPRLLLCSAWQTHNIGDIAHTPSAMALLERYLPEVDVTVWEHKPLTDEIRAFIQRRFPRAAFVHGKLAADGSTDDAALARAVDAADFALHSSGPATIMWDALEAFARRTGRGYGVYGVTYGLYGTPERDTLSRARFAYFRDSLSLQAARDAGVRAPVMEWSPDVAFGFDMRDDARADAYLASVGLAPGGFACCISRLRNTPFWLMPGNDAPFDAEKDARNQAMREHDHRPLRDAIVAVVRGTSLKVLVCPEDETQVAITRENLVDPLPDDVRARVVWRDRFWLPDEALSVYARSVGLFGSEMHSPIMCVGNGIGAIVCRWAEQSTKGIMWRDIGLGDWLFDFDVEADLARVAPAALKLVIDPPASAIRARDARTRVRQRFAETMAVVGREVEAAVAARGD